MNTYVKIALLVVGIIILNMVLFNVFHVKDYVAIAISLAVTTLAVTYEAQRNKKR